MSKGKNIIFVGGAPRSGTTLVQRYLNSHHNIYGGPEFDRIVDITELRRAFHSSIDWGRIDIYFSKEEIDNSLCQFIEQILFIKANKENCDYISEKTPKNILIFNELLDYCKDSKYIFLVRDPRAIIASMKVVYKNFKSSGKTPPDYITSVAKSANLIKEYWDNGILALNKKPNNIYVCYYEELINNSKKVLDEIFKFLNINYELSEIINFSEKFDVSGDNIWYENSKLSGGINKKSLTKWKKELSVYEQYYIFREFNVYSSHFEQFYNLEVKGNILFHMKYSLSKYIPNLIRRFFKLRTVIKLKRKLKVIIKP